MRTARPSIVDRRRVRGALCGVSAFCVGLLLVASVQAQAPPAASTPQPPAQEDTAATPAVISWTEAHEYIGEDVIVEGEIIATHTSPLSTLLSFDRGFNRFTAVIRPANRKAFPPAPEEFYKGKLVRISGRLIEYETKAEIVLTSPDQIVVLDHDTPLPPAAADNDDSMLVTLELLRRLTAIEASMESLADRLDLILAALENQAAPDSPATYLLPGRVPETEPPPRPAYQRLQTVKRGMTAAKVQQLIGEPAFVDPSSEGGEIWYYGSGRSISFNKRGRVEAMAGFQQRR
jgi:hypothetical protein